MRRNQLFIFLVFLSLFPAEKLMASSVKIKAIEVSPESEEAYVRGTLPFSAGVEWKPSLGELAEKFLRSIQRFKEISVDWKPDSATLYVRVEPIRFIENVKWSKDKPQGESGIRLACLRAEEDDAMTQERISQISTCVVERLRVNGLLDAQAFAYSEGSTLFLEVNQGKAYQVEDVQIIGLNSISSSYIHNRIRNKSGKAYKPLDLAADTKNILSDYLSSGFYQVKVSDPTVVVQPAKRTVRISWKIQEGRRYEIRFEGGYTSRRPIERILDLKESSPDWFLDEIQERIRQDLLGKGYLDVSVTQESIRLRGGTNRIIFATQKGRQYWLSSPLWVGLRDPEKIQKIYRSISKIQADHRYSEEEFRRIFEDSFFPALIENGFQDVRVKSLEFSVDRKSFTVQPVIYMDEGPRRVIQSVEILGLPSEYSKSYEAEDLAYLLRKSNSFDAIKADEKLKVLLQNLRQNGYLDVLGDLDWNASTKSVRVNITLGPRYRIEDAIVRGLVRTQLSVIRKQFRFSPGEYFSQTKLNDTTAEILRLGLARSIDIQVFEKDSTTQKVYLLIEISEAARFRFEIGPGFGTSDGLRGVAKGTYSNIAGTGRRLTVYAKASRRLKTKRVPEGVIGVDNIGDIVDPEQVKRTPFLERRMTIEYFEPNFVRRTIDGRVVLKHELLSRRQYGVENYSIASLLDWRPYRFLTYTPSYKIEYSDPFNIQIANLTRRFDDTGPSRLHSTGHRFLFNFVDDTFNPSRGLRLDNSFDLYNKFFGSDKNFWVGLAEQTLYLQILKISRKSSVGFALSLNTGFSSEFSDTPAIPVDKRFRLGGEASVRGFAEDGVQPLDRSGNALTNGGKSIFYFRSELNVPLFGWVDLLSFFDGGTLYQSNSDYRPWDLVALRYGAGAGLRLNTPVGPVKFGYAFVLDRKPGEDMGQIYFGVGPL